MSADETHSGDELRAAWARAAIEKYGDVPGVIAAMEAMPRSEVWVYVTLDPPDDDGEPKIVNATGFFPDEHAAFLAGCEYERQWATDSPDEEPVRTKPLPLFIDRRQIDDETT